MKNQPIDTDLNVATFLLIIGVVLSEFNLDIGFSLKPYMIVSLILFVFFVRSFTIHHLASYETTLLFFFFLFSLTGLYANYPGYSLRLILGAWLTIGCYFVMRFVFSKTSITSIEKVISVSGLVFNFTSLVYYFIGLTALNFNFWGNGFSVHGVMMDRNFPRLIGVLSDPNVFAFYNMLFLFYYLTHLKVRFSKVGLLLASMTMLLTLSRGALIAIAFGVLILFVTAKLKQKIKMFFLFPVGIFIVGLVSERVLNINIIQLLINRFTSVQSDNGSGRVGLWQNGMEMLKDHPFGIGIFNFQAYNEAIYGKQILMHNTFLEVLVEGGPFLFVLYLSIFLIVIYQMVKVRNSSVDTKFLLYALCSMFVLMTSLSMIVNESLFLLFALIWRYQLEVKRVESRKTGADLEAA